MRTYEEAVDYRKKPKRLEKPNRSPVRDFTTPWLRGNSGFFYVHLSIVGPITKQPEGYLPLSQCQTHEVLKAVTNMVELLEKELRRKDTVSR